MVIFFFSSRRRHTRWNCDWSSDVCSSDLSRCERRFRARTNRPGVGPGVAQPEHLRRLRDHQLVEVGWALAAQTTDRFLEIGRASCRERVEMQVGEVSVNIENTSAAGTE